MNPTPGTPCTICYLTDRHAATAIKVSPTGAKVTVREDTATRTDGNGMSDQQQYEYTPNPDGALHIFHRDAEGKYRGRGKVLVLGTRRTYHDFSF